MLLLIRLLLLDFWFLEHPLQYVEGLLLGWRHILGLLIKGAKLVIEDYLNVLFAWFEGCRTSLRLQGLLFTELFGRCKRLWLLRVAPGQREVRGLSLGLDTLRRGPLSGIRCANC